MRADSGRDDVTIRAAVEEDHAEFARLFRELAVPDPVPNVNAFRERLAATTLIAEDAGGHVVGYLFYELLDGVLYVRNVVSDPSRRRAGIGRRLLREAAGRGRTKGATTWCLNVKDDNTAAIRLYESLGMRVAFATHVLRLAWSAVSDLAQPGVHVVTREVPASEDESIEPALGMPRGLIESRRTNAFALFAARDGEQVVGFTAFNPAFPGAFPFRANDEGTARALLEAMVPRRRPLEAAEPWRKDGVQLVLEGNEALADALVSRGAERVFRLLHLVGPLPADRENGKNVQS